MSIKARMFSISLALLTSMHAQESPVPQKLPLDAHLSFEVATIKPSDPATRGRIFDKHGRNFFTRNTTLKDLIEYAYDLHGKQVIGGPAWIDEDKFDLSAVPDREGQPSDRQWKEMLQNLLADRFHLTFHHEKKELSVYILSVARGSSNGSFKVSPKNLTPSDSTAPNFDLSIDPTPGGMSLNLRHGSMTNLAVFGLQGAILDRPVLDQTNLPGRYDATLTWMPDDSQFAGHLPAAPTDNPAPSLFTAIQEQLGLKLEPTKGLVEVLAIDHVEKPSAN